MDLEPSLESNPPSPLPISALDSYASFCKVVDSGVNKNKRKAAEMEMEEKEEKGNEGISNRAKIQKNGIVTAPVTATTGTINAAVKANVKAVITHKDESEDSEDDVDDEESEDMDIDDEEGDYDEDEEEEEDNNENDIDSNSNGNNTNAKSILPRYQADTITISEKRPTKIDYSFMDDTPTCNGSKGVDGIVVRQPSIVRDLWAQVRCMRLFLSLTI